MTREESIRKEILFHLYAVRPRAVLASTLWKEARKQSYEWTQAEINAELQFLADENLVITIEIKGSTDRLYRIGGEGVRVYEQNYAA